MESVKLRIRCKTNVRRPSGVNMGEVLDKISSHIVDGDGDETPRQLIHIGHVDPSSYPCFRPSTAAVDAVSSALHSASFNCYAPNAGLLQARQAIAKDLSRDLPYSLSYNDVYVTVGCENSIQVVLGVLAAPGANILIPTPGYPSYESHAESCMIQTRHYSLIPHQNWEVDLDSVQALVDQNTVAIVLINPGNSCGNVYTYHHLQKIAETARKLGIVVIADEVYGRIAFGSNPFVPMGTFGSIVPVLTIGSLSKRWVVPGWRFGWIVTNDPNCILKNYGVSECIEQVLQLSPDPPTFIQGAIPHLFEETRDDFFSTVLDTLKKDADICWENFKDISCITCPYKPQGGMSLVVKLDLCMMKGIKDDLDFCNKLAKEEFVLLLPGFVVGMKNWVRISFSIEPSLLQEALQRMKEFCQRHTKE